MMSVKVYTKRFPFYKLVAIICILSMHKCSSSGHRILLLPFPWHSRFKQLDIIGTELKERGHDVSMIAPSSERFAERTVLKRIVYKVNYESSAVLMEKRFKSKAGFGLDWFQNMQKLVVGHAEAIMANEEIQNAAKNTSLFVIDVVFYVAPVIATYFNKSWVLLSTTGHLVGGPCHLFGAAVNPSYLPVMQFLTKSVSPPQHMNFWERSFNLLMNIVFRIVSYDILSMDPATSFAQKYGTGSVFELLPRTSLLLITIDYALEYPRMDPPNIKIIGPLTPRDADNPLKAPFSEIFSKSDTWSLLVSLGMTNAVHKRDGRRLLEAFKSVNHTVVMKYNTTAAARFAEVGREDVICGEQNGPTYLWESKSNEDGDFAKDKSCEGRDGTDSSKNYKTIWTDSKKSSFCLYKKPCQKSIFEEKKKSIESYGGVQLTDRMYVFNWLPQQDILQNSENVILFTHCGISSLYEALYHAKLVICMPLFGDQFDNAGRVLSRRVGRVIHMADMSKERLQEEIEILIRDKTYLENVRKLSKRLRRREVPSVKMAAFWIEAVLEEDGDMSYLKPASNNMPLYVYLCLDIIIFWTSCLMLICWLTRFLYKKLYITLSLV